MFPIRPAGGHRLRRVTAARPDADDPRTHALVVIGIVLLAFNLRTAAVSVGPVLAEISESLGLSGAAFGIFVEKTGCCGHVQPLFGPEEIVVVDFHEGRFIVVGQRHAGAASQRANGTGVTGGILSATLLGVIFVPIFFVWVLSLLRSTPHTPSTTDGPVARIKD